MSGLMVLRRMSRYAKQDRVRLGNVYNPVQQHPPRLSTMRTRGVTFLGAAKA